MTLKLFLKGFIRRTLKNKSYFFINANLSTANSIERSKEVGIKKSLGLTKHDLQKQFFFESSIITFTALVISLIFILLFIKPFSELLGVTFPINFLGEGFLWIILTFSFLFVSFLGGVYPAFYISSFNTIAALKGKMTLGRSFVSFQNMLVIAQFTISISLVFFLSVIQMQLNLLRQKSPGFNKENIIVIADPSEKLGDKSEAFIQRLEKHPEIINANVCSDFPGSGAYFSPISASKPAEPANHLLTNFSAGYSFLKTFNIKIAEGRDFDKNLDDKQQDRVILNESAVKVLRLTNPLNQHITTKDLNSLKIDNEKKYQIIGVVKDFNFESLHKKIRPIAIFLNKRGAYISIRVNPGNIDNTIKILQETWEAFMPGEPFEYVFVDDQLNNLYKTELHMSRLFTILTTLTIVIAATGLFGLTLLMVQQRVKEIGIRKVLGAHLADVLFILNKEYIKGIAIAFIISLPIAYLGINQWLSNFAYKTDIPLALFILIGVIALTMTLLTTSLQTIKAAIKNPVDSLRSE